MVFGLQAIDAAATVQLAAQHLVGLHKSLKFASKVGVLSLEALSVLLEGIALGIQVTIVGAVLCGSDTEALNVATDGEEGVFLLL